MNHKFFKNVVSLILASYAPIVGHSPEHGSHENLPIKKGSRMLNNKNII